MWKYSEITSLLYTPPLNWPLPVSEDVASLQIYRSNFHVHSLKYCISVWPKVAQLTTEQINIATQSFPAKSQVWIHILKSQTIPGKTLMMTSWHLSLNPTDPGSWQMLKGSFLAAVTSLSCSWGKCWVSVNKVVVVRCRPARFGTCHAMTFAVNWGYTN